MKILFLVNHYNTLRVFRKELLIKLHELGHEVIVSLPEDKQEYMDELKSFGCELVFTQIDRKNTNPLKDLKIYFDYKKLLKEIKPDRVLTYTAKPNIYGIKAASELKIPCFATITGLGATFQKESLSKKIISMLYRWSLPHATKVFCQNEGNKSILIEIGAVKEKQVVLVPGSGVNTSDFAFCEYPKDNNKITFLFTGRIMPEKGVDVLFEAIERLNKDYHNLMFNFIGWFEGDYEEKIKNLTNKGYINYFGFQKNVKPFVEECNCLVLPSYYQEGMNNALLEASSIGRPIITTNWYGCKETIIDGETGFLCEIKSVDSLYDSLKKFIDLPYEDKIKMGKNARDFMIQKFDKNIVVNMYLDKIKL